MLKAYLNTFKPTAYAPFDKGHPMRILYLITTLSVLVGIAGVLLFTYGVWLIYRPAGFIAAGLLCLLWSWLVSKMFNPVKPDKGD